MDDSAQGIVDKPISADEMAAIDQAASQYGAVVQPTSNLVMPTSTNSDDSNQADEPLDDNIVPSNVPGVIQPAGGPEEPEANPVEPVADETPAPFVDQPEEDVQVEEAINSDQTPSTNNSEDEIPQPVDEQNFVDDNNDAQPPFDSVSSTQTNTGTDEELFEVKQHALEELTPIVSTLDLPAEERFDTLMMIIRASDDKKLIRPAYEAANEIADKDKKARALLDVINEVNYLTQASPDQ